MQLLSADLSSFVGIFNQTFLDTVGLVRLVANFSLNLLAVWLVVHFLYYPKSRRRDYYFAFLLLSASIFMMIYLMDGSKMQIGAALGLFAVFGIIRYRTESVPIREMSYLFFLVAISVVNGTTAQLSFVEHIAANILFLAIVWLAEITLYKKNVSSKLVRYDNIDLIKPACEAELKADLEERLGIEIIRVEVGAVDFLTDMAMLKVHYVNDHRGNSVNHLFKI